MQYDKLTVAEKALVAVFPVQALVIKGNIDNAFNMATSRMGAGTNAGLNDKKDAFRHAYFNAINTRDCPFSLIPPASGETIVKNFAIAHESEVPAPLYMEKQMDLWNNVVGINYASWLFFKPDSEVADAIMNKLNSGELRYIKPLDNILSKRYDANGDGIQDCSICLNGIVATSSLSPTSQ